MMLMPLMSSSSLSHRRCRASHALVSEVVGKNSESQVEILSTCHSGWQKNIYSDPVKPLLSLRLNLSELIALKV